MRRGWEVFILLSDTGNATETIADLPAHGDILAVIRVYSAIIEMIQMTYQLVY